jgi:hypothetical protein
MDPSPERLPVDDEFDRAFEHLADCRIAYEDDPRDPELFARLGRARAALEDARVRMRAERERLGLPHRNVQLPPAPHFDAERRAEWQTIQGEG